MSWVKLVTTFNLFTSIAWIAVGTISAILSFLFLRKNPRKRLIQLFFCGFMLWALSLLFNGINFAVAYQSLAAANIFRDLCVITGVASAGAFFLGALGISKGAESLNWIAYVISLVVIAALSTVGSIYDWTTYDGIEGFKTTDTFVGKLCVQIIPAIFVIAGLVLMIRTQRLLSDRSVQKKRLLFYILGYSTVLIGLVMFLIDFIINDFIIPISPYVFSTLAVLSWAAGPILMLTSFYIKVDTSPRMIHQVRIGETYSQTLDPEHTN